MWLRPFEATLLPLPRLLFIQSLIAVALAILAGIVVTVQFSFDLAKFGGLDDAPRVLTLSAVRVLGPGVSASASLYALIVWTHRLDENATRSHLLRAAPSTVGLVVLIIPISTALAIASGCVTLNWAYRVPWDPILASRSMITMNDLGAAGLSMVVNVALNGAFCWFALPLMRRRSWSLLQELGAAWAGFIVLRFISRLLRWA